MIRRSYIDNKAGGQIHLAESGEGPTILLLHQTPRSWDEFREVMELLKSDFHLVAMDLPGMGASSPMGREASIEFYAKAAAQVIEHISDQPVTVCGHHTGGIVAIEVAASRPELVNSLVLSSTPWVDERARTERSKNVPIDTVDTAPDGRHLIELWRQRAPYYPDDVDYMNRFVMDALKAQDAAAGHHAVGRYHMEAAVPKIQCPVLLVEHSKDPFASKHTADLKAAFPNASFEQILDGHVALEVGASEFSTILGKWIKKRS